MKTHGARIALLVGVGQYDAESISNIPVVEADVARLQTALEASGYEVRTLLTAAGHEQPTRNRVQEAIRDTLERAPERSTLLLYFNGHGKRIGSRDYLCPVDTPNRARAGMEGSLIPADLGACALDSLDNSRAQTIVFVVDACRDEESTKAIPSEEFAQPSLDTRQRVYSIYACGSGEVAFYNYSKLGGSVLTIALADALRPGTSPRTIEEVFDHLGPKMHSLAEEANIPIQVPHIQAEVAESFFKGAVICSGSGDDEFWRRASDSAHEYVLGAAAEECAAAHIGVTLEELLDEGRKHIVGNTVTTADSYWLDADLLRRYMERLTKLTAGEYAGPLSPADRLVCVGLLVLMEATLRAAYLEYGISPPNRSRLRSLDRNETLSRRRDHLRQRGSDADASIVDTWLRQQAVLGDPDIWHSDVFERLATVLAQGLETRKTRQIDLIDQFRKLAAALASDSPLKLGQFATYHDDGHEFTIDMAACFASARLAYAMSVDLRQVGEPLVHELGLRSRLEYLSAKQQLTDVRWSEDPDNAYVIAPEIYCTHAATDLCARSIVGRIRAIQVEHSDTIRAPFFVGEHLIRAVRTEGEDVAYTAPVSQITLEPHSVRSLLMGKDLYGSPKVVIRELYQNALDACRYRAVRERYLSLRYSGRPENWRGAIRFSLHRLPGGALVLDCTDNGVGMGDAEVDGSFTRAGRRFVDLEGFQVEQQRWAALDAGLQLYPNSRFGIGVFSYFLLAEEVEVYSVRQSSEGSVENGIALHLSSVSGLVTKKPMTGDPAGLTQGGTMVRLFLNEDEWLGLGSSLSEMVTELLGYAEFDLMVEEEEETTPWPAGKFIGASPRSVPAVSAEFSHVWWIDGEADLLADGVRLDVRTKGYLANLGGPHSPRLDVSRNRTEQWDKPWVEAELSSTHAMLKRSPFLSMEWLWALSENSPTLCEEVQKALSASGEQLRVTRGTDGGPRVDLASVGIAPVDRLAASEVLAEIDLARTDFGRPYFLGPRAVTAWRTAVWKSAVEVGRESAGGDVEWIRLGDGVERLRVGRRIPVEPPRGQSAPLAVTGNLLTWMLQSVREARAMNAAALQVRASDIVRAAHEHELTLAEVSRRVLEYVAGPVHVLDIREVLRLGGCDRAPTLLEALVSNYWAPERGGRAIETQFSDDSSAGFSASRVNYKTAIYVLSQAPGSSLRDLEAAAKMCNYPELSAWAATATEPDPKLLRLVAAQSGGSKARRLDPLMPLDGVALSESSLDRSGALAAWLDGVDGGADKDDEQRAERESYVRAADAGMKRILSRDGDGVAPWLNGRATPEWVAVLSARYKRTAEEIAGILEEFPGITVDSPPLGRSWPAMIVPPSVGKVYPVRDDQRVLLARPLEPSLAGFVESLHDYAIDGSKLVADARVAGVLLPAEWGQYTRPASRLIVDRLRILERMRGLTVPGRLTVPQTLEFCAFHVGGLRGGLGALEELKDYGIEHDFPSGALPEEWVSDERALTLGSYLSHGWPLSIAVSAMVDTYRSDVGAWLHEELWWLDQLGTDARDMLARCSSLEVPGDWVLGDDALAFHVALAVLESGAGSASNLVFVAVSRCVSIGRVLAACARMGLAVVEPVGVSRGWSPDWIDYVLLTILVPSADGGGRDEGITQAASALNLSVEVVEQRLSAISMTRIAEAAVSLDVLVELRN